ncbi:MAG: aminopeptidase [Spirochaetaceae bacterium]|jgi:aminopeptidase|nr:aminopeptidase [Spirochaetaceae bacterium]
MKDTRLDALADVLVNYSVKARPGERVLIQSNNPEPPFVRALIRSVYRAGALPFVRITDATVERELLLSATEAHLALRAQNELAEMREMDCYIGFTAMRNLTALADVPQEKTDLLARFYHQPLNEVRLGKRWVVLRYPTAAMAQLSGMSEEGFEDFFFKVCTLDWQKFSRAMDPLKALMDRTDRVRIVSPGTDLSFSIKGMGSVKCDGEKNIPDGEVYTAPVRDSVNGAITYNTPSLHGGFVFEGITFTFKDGKIVKAAANDTDRLNRVLDTDGGARYVGEFSLGLHPLILKPMKETLFDEKIAGSLHLTPGNAYDDCDNGNRSAIHWDLVLIQRPETGGGEIYFDSKLVRKDGKFVLPELAALNP